MLEDAVAVTRIEHATFLEQRMLRYDLTLDRTANKTREERSAVVCHPRVVCELVGKQFEKVRRAVEIEQTNVVSDLLPCGLHMRRRIQLQKPSDLLRHERLNANLAYVEVILDAQGLAVVEAATRENGPVAGREVIAQEAAPLLHTFAEIGGVAVRHLVQRIQKQQHAALSQQRFEVGDPRRLPAPLRAQPVEGRRCTLCRILVERIRAQRDE